MECSGAEIITEKVSEGVAAMMIGHSMKVVSDMEHRNMFTFVFFFWIRWFYIASEE